MISPQEAACALAVANTGSFRKAASELYLSQPAVSAYVDRLETRLGSRIFDRTRSGTSLTSTGRDILPHLSALLVMHEQVEAACKEISRADQSVLAITSHRIGLLHYLPPALRVMRGIVEGLVIHTIQETEGVALVANGEAEIGLGWRATGDAEANPQVEELPIADTRTVVFVPNGHRLAECPQITPADLAGETIVSVRSPLVQRHTDTLLDGVPGLSWLFTDDAQVVLMMVGEGVGVSILIDVAAAIAPPSTVAIPITPSVDFELTLLRRRDATLSPPAKILWDLLSVNAVGH